MNRFITIITVNYPTELVMPRMLLEAEGIECRTLDELTAQVNPMYSQAIGGVKLQVKETDLQKAVDILKEGGYLTEEDLQPYNSLSWLDDATSQLPLLKNLRVELRLMILVSIGVLLLLGVLRFAI
ncbi:MAG: DUF2007 domain-containing protein [Flavobacteriales bacterium]|nr:DUF2007 domain-containing protein [Flavobacteriales bacterium]